MITRKMILIVSGVLLLSLGTFAITKVAGQKHISSPEKNTVQNDQAPDDETPTNDDPWKEIEKVVGAYSNGGGVDYRGSMRLLDESGEKEKMLEQMSFEYSLLGDEYYYRMGEFECVGKRDFIMTVDNQAKSITVVPTRLKANSSKQNSLFDPTAFRKILEERSAMVKVTQQGDLKIITVDSIQDPKVQGYRIYYNPTTYKVKKMEIGMVRLNSVDDGEDVNQNLQQSPDDDTPGDASLFTYFLEINYDESRLLSVTKEDFHPESKFIKISQNNIQLTPAYSNYSLTNAGE